MAFVELGTRTARIARVAFGFVALLVIAAALVRTMHLPPGALPGLHRGRLLRAGGALRVCALRTPAGHPLDRGFYDQECVSAPRFLLRGAPPLPTLAPLCLMAQCSRCGSTLLMRMLDARGDVITYREPIVLTLLVREGARRDSKSWLPLARAVLASFLTFAEGRLAVVKLPSTLAEAPALAALSEAAPFARRVGLLRPASEVAASHRRRGRSSGFRALNDASLSQTLTRKINAIRSWSSQTLDFAAVAGPDADARALSAAFGLPPPTPLQSHAMLREQAWDAKASHCDAARASRWRALGCTDPGRVATAQARPQSPS